MDTYSDNFISYNNDFDVKLEKSSDHEISLESSSLGTCDATPPLYPSLFSPSVRGLLTSHDLFNLSDNLEQKASLQKRKPFTIIKTNKGEANEFFEVKVESEEKLLSKSKLIMKREKAKQRAKSKMDIPICTKIESNTNLEEIDNIEADPKTKKKMIQMIRNRISAQNSRDRKKAYLSQLEAAKNKLYAETVKARQEKNFILAEIAKMKEQNANLARENKKLLKVDDSSCQNCNQTQREGPSEFGNPNQTIEELTQTIIKKSNPSTSNLLSKNKGLFKNTFSFALSLSLILLTKFGAENGLENTESKGEYNLPRSSEHVIKAMGEEANGGNGEESLNNIYQYLNDMSKFAKASNMANEIEEQNALNCLKQEDNDLKGASYMNFLMKYGEMNIPRNPLSQGNFLNLNLDEDEKCTFSF